MKHPQMNFYGFSNYTYTSQSSFANRNGILFGKIYRKICSWWQHTSEKYVRIIFDATLLKTKEIVGQSAVYFVLDKTIDALCFKYTSSYLNWRAGKTNVFLNLQFRKTNRFTIMQYFNDEIMYYRVWMVVTDQALHVFTEFFNLKQIRSSLGHITCIVHVLHRVSESVHVE